MCVMAYDKVLWYSSPVRSCYREGVHHTHQMYTCTVQSKTSILIIYMLYSGHSVSLNLCMSFAKCALKWIVVNIILCPIPLPYKMAEAPTCNGF